MLQFEKYFRETSWPSFYFCSSWNVDCCSNPDAVISYPIVSPEMIPCAREADNPWCWMAANPPPALLSLCPPLPHTHTSLTQSRGPYLCLDHASSLVSQVLQGSGNINLFSTCNRPKIGLSSKQWSNPAHICQSLFILGSLWKSAAIENYYIHPSKDLDKSHWLFLDKICKRIFLGPGAIMHSNTPHTGFHVRVVFKNRFRWCPCRQSTNIQECARAHISKLITMIYSRSAAVILMINPCNSCLPSAGISCCWACFGFTSLWS